VILTSNIGIEEYKKLSGFGFDDKISKDIKVKDKVKENLAKVFKPELLNRIDKVVVFDPLKDEELQVIAKLQIEILQKKLEQKGIKLSFDKSVLVELSKKNYDQIYGARPLIREIENSISNEISELIISGKIKTKDKVKITVQSGRIKVSKA
jgi:ATP-dependent Clp protease ATP-binding subunit ClpA